MVLASLLVIAAGPVDEPASCSADTELCNVALPENVEAVGPTSGTLLFFWGVGCPRCAEAEPFVETLAAAEGVPVEWIEVRQNKAGRRMFAAHVERLGIRGAGVPAFVWGDDYVIGYRPGVTEKEIARMLRGETSDRALVDVPWVGAVDTREIPLGTFTVIIGLIDGVNPCAMWVLTVLLGILTHTRSRRRLFAYGFIFVGMSGAVYFLFMTAWSGLFALAGMARAVTVLLGVVVAVMGLINLKELVWFKQGPSLTISDRAKPPLYKRMRAIANATRLPAALLGITALAFFANLIELGCTIGLPAVYTRILSLRAELGPLSRAGYLVLYNVAYVVPLATIVVIYAVTLHRLTLSERGAKVLKGISGVLLLLFGIILIAAPGLLSGPG